MSEPSTPLIPLYEIGRISSDPFICTKIGMLAKSGAVSMSHIPQRGQSEGGVRALDITSVNQLIDNGTIALRPQSDTLGWSFVGGYEAFMQKLGRKS